MKKFVLCSTIYMQFTGTQNTKRPFKYFLQFKTLSLPNIFHRPIHITQQNQTFQVSYKKGHPTYKKSNLSHLECRIATKLDFILMVNGTMCYAPISSSRVTWCVEPRLMRDHHSGAQSLSSPALIDIVSSPLWWCTKAWTAINIYITTYPVIG